MQQKYDLKKIKFSVDEGTFERAVGLYEVGKVTSFEENRHGYSAVVKGTKPYSVFVSSADIFRGNCNCYVSQERNELCKHMVAVAIYSILRGNKIKEEDSVLRELACSEKIGELDRKKLAEVKKEISSAMKFIKSYNGPSKKWFEYTYSLREGSRMLESIFSELPISKQTSDLIIKTLLKLDDKLCRGGVDDSDGAIGNLIYGSVEVLKDFVKFDKNCLKSFKIFETQETCFGWEKELIELIKE